MTTPTEIDDFGYYAETYDESVPDWPGEMDFYGEYAEEARRKGLGFLELACGTGRVIIRLAGSGIQAVGLDHSEHMLAIAREKSPGMENIQWVSGDMRHFELGRQYGLVMIPGQAFHNLNTPDDQAACFASIHRHLAPDGIFVLHLDAPEMDWLGDLTRDKGGKFELEKQIRHPRTGRLVNHYQAWWYERSTQTAITQIAWEELDDSGQVVRRVETDKHRLHSIFPFEIEHLMARTGFSLQARYGDFFRHPLEDKSTQMIWVATKG